VADDGGLVRVEASLIAHATTIAEEHGISVYDAAYVADGGQPPSLHRVAAAV
jgi:hypothetical protein